MDLRVAEVLATIVMWVVLVLGCLAVAGLLLVLVSIVLWG